MADPAFSEAPRPIIKAIETHYNGHHFRSRLEARWAVFLDALDIGYRYEPEGYVINGEPYLPDFYLPTLDAFLEIKPAHPAPASREDRVAWGLAQGTGKMVYILAGPISPPGVGAEWSEATAYFPDAGDDYPYFWCECARCGFVGLQFEGRSARLACGCWRGTSDREHNSDTPRLRRAYDQARAMRFEFRHDYR